MVLTPLSKQSRLGSLSISWCMVALLVATASSASQSEKTHDPPTGIALKVGDPLLHLNGRQDLDYIPYTRVNHSSTL